MVLVPTFALVGPVSSRLNFVGTKDLCQSAFVRQVGDMLVSANAYNVPFCSWWAEGSDWFLDAFEKNFTNDIYEALYKTWWEFAFWTDTLDNREFDDWYVYDATFSVYDAAHRVFIWHGPTRLYALRDGDVVVASTPHTYQATQPEFPPVLDLTHGVGKLQVPVIAHEVVVLSWHLRRALGFTDHTNIIDLDLLQEISPDGEHPIQWWFRQQV